MKDELTKVSRDIITLLNNSDGPISAVEIQQYLDVPYYLINLSLDHLIGEEKIYIESKNKINYIPRSFYEQIDWNRELQFC